MTHQERAEQAVERASFGEYVLVTPTTVVWLDDNGTYQVADERWAAIGLSKKQAIREVSECLALETQP